MASDNFGNLDLQSIFIIFFLKEHLILFLTKTPKTFVNGKLDNLFCENSVINMTILISFKIIRNSYQRTVDQYFAVKEVVAERTLSLSPFSDWKLRRYLVHHP